MAPTMQRLRSKSINWMSNLPTPAAAASNALTTVKSRSGGAAAPAVERKATAPALTLPMDLLTVIFELYLETCQNDRRCRITPLLRLSKTTLPILLRLLYTAPVIHTRIQLYKFVALPSTSTHSYVRTLIIEPNGKWDMVDPRDKPWEAIALSQSSRYGKGSGAYEWRPEMGYGKSAREKREAMALLSAFKQSIRGDEFDNLRRLVLRDCHTMEPAVFQLAKYEELHLDGQCWALVADTIPSSTSSVLLTTLNVGQKPYHHYGATVIPGAFPYLKTISWNGAIADLPYYAMFRIIQEARTGRYQASILSGREEGKPLRLDICYNELWRDPEEILPNAVTPLGMPSPAHGNAPGLAGYFGAARDSSEAVEQLATQIQQAVGVGHTTGSGTATPIGAGMIAPAPTSSSTHKLQKLREQQENHMAILERLADSDGVDSVQISFSRHPHVFCRERDEDEVGLRRAWRDDMRSERHKRLVLRECERGIGCRPSARSPAQTHTEKLLRHRPAVQDPSSPPNRWANLDVQVPF